MKDYIKHVGHTHKQYEGYAWCGAKLTSMDWHFGDIDHAAYNAMQKGRLVMCKNCAQKIIECLNNEVNDE